MINKNVLNNMFNMDEDKTDITDIVSKEDKIDRKKPDDIIYDNIDKANQLLDTILNSVISQSNDPDKQLNARLMEVAGQLIDKITTAATSITSADIDYADIQLKHQTLLNKQKELDWKINKDGSISTKDNVERQVIITDRESILSLMRNKKEIEIANDNSY